jgi:hypothetical protein
MKWFAGLRALVFLRRASRALERQARATELLAKIAKDTWDEHHKPYKAPVFADLRMDPELVAEEWKARKEVAMITEDEEFDPYDHV